MLNMLCSPDCKHCQQYNDEWAICWHIKIKGSKVQIGKRCAAELKKEREPDVQRT